MMMDILTTREGSRLQADAGMNEFRIVFAGGEELVFTRGQWETVLAFAHYLNDLREKFRHGKNINTPGTPVVAQDADAGSGI